MVLTSFERRLLEKNGISVPAVTAEVRELIKTYRFRMRRSLKDIQRVRYNYFFGDSPKRLAYPNKRYADEMEVIKSYWKKGGYTSDYDVDDIKEEINHNHPYINTEMFVSRRWAEEINRLNSSLNRFIISRYKDIITSPEELLLFSTIMRERAITKVGKCVDLMFRPHLEDLAENKL